jgi:hypothetical protein
MKKLKDFTQVLSYLEPEGQRTKAGVTYLLLGPFYYIALFTGGYRLMNNTVLSSHT